jgi:hypothetical protein
VKKVRRRPATKLVIEESHADKDSSNQN